MKLTHAVTAFALVAVAAACDGAPTNPASAEGVGPALNQAPVANITLVHKKPISNDPYGIDWFFRFDLSASGSYDPEGGSLSYAWSSSCYYVPNSYTSTFRVDVQPGDTCQVNLYVTDPLGAVGHAQAYVDSNGNMW
jgi:hypothetical protein